MPRTSHYLIAIAVAGGIYFMTNAKLLLITNTPGFTRWDELLKKYGRQFQVPWRWGKAVMWNESSLGSAASVQAGMREPGSDDGWSFDGKSRGLMQLTLATARDLRPGTSIADLDNPEISIMLGMKYLGQHMRRFGGDREKTIRAYNGGPGFANTKQGQTQTPIYYAKFMDHLGAILEAQPGPDTEIG